MNFKASKWYNSIILQDIRSNKANSPTHIPIITITLVTQISQHPIIIRNLHNLEITINSKIRADKENNNTQAITQLPIMMINPMKVETLAIASP